MEENVSRENEGFRFLNVGSTTVLDSRAAIADGQGFIVEGSTSSVVLKRVRAVRSQRHGIQLVEGNGSKVVASVARRSSLDGIRVEAATASTILRATRPAATTAAGSPSRRRRRHCRRTGPTTTSS